MAAEGMRVMATVGGQFVANQNPAATPSVEDDVEAAVKSLDGYGNVTFWYLPEELRYWYDSEGSEYSEGIHLMQWRQAHDPERRPAAMYSPNHAGRSRYYAELEWSHVLIGGAYVGFSTMDSFWTLGWARWKARELMAAVHGTYHLGSDHGDGGRTPMIASWCSSSEPNYGAAEAYNFVFATLAEGARGVGVWSYFHGIETGSPPCLAGHAAAFNVLQDPTHPLGRALLHGTRDPRLTVTVTAGAAETEPFQNSTSMPPETLPSVVATLVFFEGKRYIVAANSRSDEVTVAFGGAGRTGQVEVLTEGRSVAMVNGGSSDTFAGKADHLYVLPPG